MFLVKSQRSPTLAPIWKEKKQAARIFNQNKSILVPNFPRPMPANFHLTTGGGQQILEEDKKNLHFSPPCGPHLPPESLLKLAQLVFFLEERKCFVEAFWYLEKEKQQNRFTFGTTSALWAAVPPKLSPFKGGELFPVAESHQTQHIGGVVVSSPLHLFLLGRPEARVIPLRSKLRPCHSSRWGCQPPFALPASSEAQILCKNHIEAYVKGRMHLAQGC